MATRFLRQFLRAFVGRLPVAKSGARLGSPPPEAVLSNYLTSHSYIRGNRVHSSAFLPRNGELSLFQTQGLDEPAIWRLGVEHVLSPVGDFTDELTTGPNTTTTMLYAWSPTTSLTTSDT